MKQGYEGKERRHAPRLPVCAEINMVVNGRESYFYTKDISATGAFVISDLFPRLGTSIEMHVSIPFMDGLMKVVGEVVRHQDYKDKDKYRNLRGIGILFKEIPEEAARAIDAFMDRIETAVSGQ
jgi:hypothetical protein